MFRLLANNFVKSFEKSLSLNVPKYHVALHTSATLNLKELIKTEEGNKVIIEAVIVPSPRKELMVKTKHDETACPLCRLNLDLKHTDVLILSQFVRSDGCLLPRRITGLCVYQQKRLTQLVSMAHRSGLMPNLVPKYSKPDPSKRRVGWKKHNRYFIEKTIRVLDKYYQDKDLKLQYFKERGLIKEIAPNQYVPCIETEKPYDRTKHTFVRPERFHFRHSKNQWN